MSINRNNSTKRTIDADVDDRDDVLIHISKLLAQSASAVLGQEVTCLYHRQVARDKCDTNLQHIFHSEFGRLNDAAPVTLL